VQPTLRWNISGAPPPGTTTPGQSGTGTGTGTGAGTGTGTGTGTGSGPASSTGTGTGTGTGTKTTANVGTVKKKHPGHHARVRRHVARVRKPRVKKPKKTL
jgi:hypothetical protein